MPPRVKRIGLMLDLKDSYDLEVARGVVRYAKKMANWKLFSRGWLFTPMADASSWTGDGIITRIHEAGLYHNYAGMDMPVVDVAGTADAPGYLKVTNDDPATGFAAARHLLECGLRRIAFFGAASAGWSEKRLVGVRQAVREFGGGEVEVREMPVNCQWNRADFMRLVAWLKRLPKPCGLVATDDPMALKAVQAAEEASLSIPKDLAVVVIGNEDVLCALAEPSLTSISCDCQRIGYEAAARLDAALAGRLGEAGNNTAIPPLPLRVRESSDILAMLDGVVAGALSYIRGHAHEGINVEDVVRSAPVSRRTLEEKFRSALGRTVYDEIRRNKIEIAKQCLEAGMPPTLAAAKSGFSTVQHFHSTFKRQSGLTPSAYARSRVGK